MPWPSKVGNEGVMNVLGRVAAMFASWLITEPPQPTSRTLCKFCGGYLKPIGGQPDLLWLSQGTKHVVCERCGKAK